MWRSIPTGSVPVFNDMVKEMPSTTMASDTKRIKIQALALDTFSTGRAYFGSFTKAQREKVVVVHNNYIISLNASKQRLVDHGLWEPFALDG